MTEEINPYRAPQSELQHVSDTGAEVAVEYSMNEPQLRNAQAYFCLHRCGGRIGFVSILMMALAIFSVVDWSWIPAQLQLANANSMLLMIAIRELFVMAVAIVSYQAVTVRVRRETRAYMDQVGMVAGASIAMSLEGGQLQVQSMHGSFAYRVADLKVSRTARGMLIITEKNKFWYLPAGVSFLAGDFRTLLKTLRIRIRDAARDTFVQRQK